MEPTNAPHNSSPSRNYATYPSLEDKRIFVTGGGGGIGQAIVHEFAKQAAKVAFVDIDTDGEKLIVHRGDHIRTGDIQDLVASLEFIATEVIRTKTRLLQSGPRGTIEDDHTTSEGVEKPAHDASRLHREGVSLSNRHSLLSTAVRRRFIRPSLVGADIGNVSEADYWHRVHSGCRSRKRPPVAEAG